MRTTLTINPARLLWALLLPLLLFASACNDKTDSQEELEKLIAQHKIDDDNAIKAYLSTNNITTFEQTASGLYIIRQNTPGTGTTPVSGAQVKTKYVGRYLSSGLRFDASIDNGSLCGCATFTVGSVIPAWNEVLVTMHRGDKVTILVPSHLGYGYTGDGTGRIPAFTPLMFDIELIEFTNP
jgi:FKBP-type peptidyl-prolyl cis-trans isomerase